VDWRARALAAEAEARDMMLQKNQNAVALHECIRELNAERLVTSGCVEKEVETRTIERVAAWLDSMISPDDGSAFYVSIRETARRDLLRQLAAALRNNTWRAP
jgi:tRNA isopentenyl-2-thiomethyl-A-37 hydroxylase MiaE